MQFVITAEHPPHLCPTANATTRKLLVEGGKQIPALAKNLGVDIITMNVFGPDHVIVAVIEAKDIETAREFVWQGRLHQWNTVKVNATWSFEEALARIEDHPAIF
jgi:hypothetical protein